MILHYLNIYNVLFNTWTKTFIIFSFLFKQVTFLDHDFLELANISVAVDIFLDWFFFVTKMIFSGIEVLDTSSDKCSRSLGICNFCNGSSLVFTQFKYLPNGRHQQRDYESTPESIQDRDQSPEWRHGVHITITYSHHCDNNTPNGSGI